MLKDAYRRGEPPADMLEYLASAPELREDLVPFWLAYDELSTCRDYAGMAGAPLPIPWTAIHEYAIRHRFAGEHFDDLVTIVRAMDEAFLRRAREQAEHDGDGE